MLICRGINSYIVQYYIPLISFAIATLAGFYIPPHEGNDRTGLIITLFLINVQMSLYISDEGPNADGSTGKYLIKDDVIIIGQSPPHRFDLRIYSLGYFTKIP